jgi:hypothetical protein
MLLRAMEMKGFRMTVKELITRLLDEPMDAEVEDAWGKPVTVLGSQRPGASPDGLTYVFVGARR